MRNLIYVSGPLSGDGDPDKRLANVERAMQAGRALVSLGYSVFVPHLTHFIDPDDSLGHDAWIDTDLTLLEPAAAVLRLPGYSTGANEEELHAIHLGIPVYRNIETIDEFVPKQRKGDERFYGILREMARLHAKKGADYGTGDDPLNNLRGSPAWGIPPWVGAQMRADDKTRRMQAFVRNGALENESIEDALIDRACYDVLSLILFREEKAMVDRVAREVEYPIRLAE